MNFRRWLSPLGFFALLLVFASAPFQAATAANPREQPPAAKAMKKSKPLPLVRVETLTPSELVKTIDLTGNVTPTRTARLASPGEGPVEACAQGGRIVREGDVVRAGQILLCIGRHQTAQAQLAAAKQTLQESERELQRIEQLVQGGAVAGAQLDTARSRYENARAQQAKAMESSNDYSVTAPWNGIVSKVHVTEGGYVAPRAPLIETFDPNSLVVQFAVPEAQAVEVQRGQTLKVRLDAYPGKTFQASISRVYPQLDAQMRTRTVEATLNPPVELIPGMFARLDIELARFAAALTLPTAALRRDAKGNPRAFVLKDGKVQQRKIQVGFEKDGRVQLLSGIAGGEQVVVAGHENLKNNAAVQVREEQRL